MTEPRVHSATRAILAPPRAAFRAMLDPESLASWRALKGMTATIFEFDAWPGGSCRMAFVYETAKAGLGKSSEDSDIVTGRFVELVPDEKIVEAAQFEAPPDLILWSQRSPVGAVSRRVAS